MTADAASRSAGRGESPNKPIFKIPMLNNRVKVAASWILLVLLTAGIPACCFRRDVTSNPAKVTDFEVGQIYELIRPAYIWRGRFSPMKLSGDEGAIAEGTQVRVRRVEVVPSIKLGAYAVLYLEVLSGEYSGRLLPFYGLFGDSEPDFVKVDPELFRWVETKATGADPSK